MSETISGYHPIFEEIKMGIGTWAWGDRLIWEYGQGYQDEDIFEAFKECVNFGIRLFDTAEVYGQGRSEMLLGQCIDKNTQKIIVASKFMPYPWKLTKSSLRNALLKSLSRLGLEQIDLYQVHAPLPPVTIENWMEAMADACHAGLVKAVGVSNYDLRQTKIAYEALLKEGVRLASNQVEYNLLERSIEKNGLMEYCNVHGIKIIAYSPLAMGLLTGKYSAENLPRKNRGWRFNQSNIKKYRQLFSIMNQISVKHKGKPLAQIAINWVIQNGAIPIPGVKNKFQAGQNAGALEWQLDMDDLTLLDEISAQLNI